MTRSLSSSNSFDPSHNVMRREPWRGCVAPNVIPKAPLATVAARGAGPREHGRQAARSERAAPPEAAP